MEKLLLLATPSLWSVPEVSFASSLNSICLVALRFTMQYSSVIFFASRDIVVRARVPLSRQVHSVGQCQGGGRLYGRGEPLLIWRAAKTYQGLRRLSRVHVSFHVKAFQDISPIKSWHIRHRLKMTNNIYQQRFIQRMWKFRKCLAKLLFFLVNWSRDETI